MTSDNQERAMLTTSEVARLLHIHINTVRRWSDRGLLIAYRISSRGDRRFRREDIVRFLTEMASNAGDPKKSNGYEVSRRGK